MYNPFRKAVLSLRTTAMPALSVRVILKDGALAFAFAWTINGRIVSLTNRSMGLKRNYCRTAAMFELQDQPRFASRSSVSLPLRRSAPLRSAGSAP